MGDEGPTHVELEYYQGSHRKVESGVGDGLVGFVSYN